MRCMALSRPASPGRGRPTSRRPTTGSRSRVVSASFAAKNFGTLVDAVREDRAAYVVERAGQPVVKVIPVPRAAATLADLAAVYRTAGRLPEEYLRAVERGLALLNGPAIPRDPWAS